MAIATPALVEPNPRQPDRTDSGSSGDSGAGRPGGRETGRRQSRSPVPGRARVVAWTVAVAALGMLVVLLGASWALAAAGDIRVSEGIAKEAGEIQRFAALGVDPATGASFTSAQRFIEVHLDSQYPDRNELFFGALPDTSWHLERRGDRTVTLGAVDPALREAMAVPGADTGRSPAHGRLSWQTVEINAPDQTGLITVVRFHAPQRQEMYAQMGVLTLVALVSLTATGFAAWWVAGRLKAPTRLFEEAVSAATAGPTVAPLPEGGRREYATLARAANRLVAGATEAYTRETQLHHDLARELQRPLAALRRNLEREQRSEPDRADSARGNLVEVRRVQNLVNDLTLLHRVELPGLIEPNPAVSVEEFVDILVDVWQTRVVELGAPGVRVVRGTCDPSAFATFDEPRLARAVDELLANAVSASPPEHVVWLSAVIRTDDRGEWVHIDVTDTGRGIPEDERALVLERFATASNDPAPGTGLGLTVAHRLVVAMGGSLTLLGNGDDPGTTARIVLPVTGAAR